VGQISFIVVIWFFIAKSIKIGSNFFSFSSPILLISM
jgi:hypothetical protein